MKKQYKQEVKSGLVRAATIQADTIQESDLAHLPESIQKYLRYVGVVGKELPHNFKGICKGRMRSSEEQGWMKLKSEQYNFFDNSTRAFYIKASKMGIPAIGLHLKVKETAFMIVKLLGLFKVVDLEGEIMNRGETVTFLNDMCCFTPATLIDKRIQWEEIDSLSAKATFTDYGITISAILYFDREGKLINFISEDRAERVGNEFVLNPWSTPIESYQEINGYRLPKEAKLVYHRPEGEFCYGEFEIVNVEYNCQAD